MAATPYMYAVHSTRPDETGAVEILFASEAEACAYAIHRSTDFRVVAAVVTRYALGELGTRHPVAWYINGEPQDHRALPAGTMYPVEPHPPVPDGAGGQRLLPVTSAESGLQEGRRPRSGPAQSRGSADRPAQRRTR